MIVHLIESLFVCALWHDADIALVYGMTSNTDTTRQQNLVPSLNTSTEQHSLAPCY